MNKSELIEKLAEKSGISPLQSEDVVSLILDRMKSFLVASKRIEIRGFGSFIVKNYEGYFGRNPKTGEQIEVKAKKLPVFKVGKELKDRLNLSE